MGKQPYKRKLIEVALPLEDINREAAREKSIRHGHPSTLHLWWARRPLAAARAVLFAQLVDDPSAHPDQFPTSEAQQVERERLFDIIRELVKWENSNDERVLAKARAEIWKSCDGNPPPILDPFAGGGTIPLEAQRLGLEAHASDLNPVAVLINKALIEIPPKWAGMPPVFPGAAESKLGGWPGATGLAEDVRRYGQWMRDEAEKRIGHLYPKAKLPDGSEATVIAWIWARTVKCPNPACGIMMPLVRSWWLGKKKGKEAYVVPSVVNGRVEFSIGHDVRQAPTKLSDGTVGDNRAFCIGCDTVVPLVYIRTEGKEGRLAEQLMALAVEGNRRRTYLAPTDEHLIAATVPRPADVPDTELPEQALGFRVQGYGMTRHVDLFTNRQLTTLVYIRDLVQEVRSQVLQTILATGRLAGSRLADGGTDSVAYADTVALYLAIAFSRTCGSMTRLNMWNPAPSKEGIGGLFKLQTISMSWDFAEANPFYVGPAEIGTSASWVSKVLAFLPSRSAGVAVQRDAKAREYQGLAVSTDPPYYSNVGYASLSDFYYVWLRQALGDIAGTLMQTLLVPKADELVADPARHGGAKAADDFFEDGFRAVFSAARRQANSEVPLTVYYAYKQSEQSNEGEVSTGWQTLLEGMIDAGWTVTGTWPVRSERSGRVRDVGSNALASSVVLVLRPRPKDAEVVDRRTFIGALEEELPGALRELQHKNIAPVDLAQAAIGPGMKVFSRYARVSEPSGATMRVHTALILINEVLAEVLSEQEGDFDPVTRWCVKWFEGYGFDEGTSGDAETLARALNISLGGLERARVARARAGKACLVAPNELDPRYDPERDDRPTVWEGALHLSRTLEEQGVQAAGALMLRLEKRVNVDAVRELSYLLFGAARNRWPQTALRFNSLVTSWSDIMSAKSVPTNGDATDGQRAFDFEDLD
ncbi:hypothetical protein C6361_28050 [Plantactinospora sp. BC1]|uniref:DUF1156 domain-containing protein n=1 Tax=Plantactinospora sp. BC1 TaxID=2108470 RepID=UPI000D1536F6|nr:DUF1156 domain-containing protein [Plantactinospora sp. BC1]AVT32679.1 hypothetical protein C6361_28050 [Plantactinospora sp. BC1]